MKSSRLTGNGLNPIQTVVLTILRMIIGWHFLYEGVTKLLIPGWSSAPFLDNAQGLFSGFYHGLASSQALVQIIDILNIGGLIGIGLALFLGIFSRIACVSGMILLGLYYFANPPWLLPSFGIPTEGNYLLVNKNLVELFALGALALFPPTALFGLDRFIQAQRNRKASSSGLANAADEVVSQPVTGGTGAQMESEIPDSSERPLPEPSSAGSVIKTGPPGRREWLKNLVSIPALGAFSYGVWKKANWEKVHSISGATIKLNTSQLKDLKGELPQGKVGPLSISRLIIGGNLIGGWSHSRDLRYVSSLFKAYNTEKKVFETLMTAEQAGINMLNITGRQYPIINKYRKIFGSKLQIMCQVHPRKDDIYSDVDRAIDNGVELIQIQGNCCDWRVRDGEMDVLVKALDHIKKQGYPAGLGAHSIQALIACEKEGLKPDFYMKTLHHDRYWSAHPVENRIPFSVDGDRSEDHNQFHDNMFCLFPEQTIEFMKNSKVPFFAFKILAGGAIHPKDAFPFAFENGADFICVGMFDYQIIEDVNIAFETLNKLKQRTRPWIA